MIPFAYGLALAVFLLDQLAKYWVLHILHLQERVTIALLPFFSLTYVENRGVSMGMFRASGDLGRWFLVGMTLLIAMVVILWIRRESGWPETIGLGLVLGGAFGNILDRIRLGYVVDYVHLHLGSWSFYVFNVADAAITIGVVILLFRSLVGTQDDKRRKANP